MLKDTKRDILKNKLVEKVIRKSLIVLTAKSVQLTGRLRCIERKMSK